MSSPAHSSRRLWPSRAFRLSSNLRRLGSASALNTSSIRRPRHAAKWLPLFRHPYGCMSTCLARGADFRCSRRCLALDQWTVLGRALEVEAAEVEPAASDVEPAAVESPTGVEPTAVESTGSAHAGHRATHHRA